MRISKNLKRCIKKLTALVSVSAVLILTTVSSVFATSTNNIDFSNQPVSTSSDVGTLCYYTNGNPRYIYSDVSGIYVFAYNNGQNVAIVGDISLKNTTVTLKRVDTSGNWLTGQLAAWDNSLQLAYATMTYGFSVEFAIPIYNNVNDGLTDVRYAIDNPNTPVSTQGYTSIEVGNIVYFDIGTNHPYDISMQSVFNSYSGVLSRTWPDDNRRYGFVNELPTANTSLSESAGTLIPWSPDASNETLVGTSNKGLASISGTTTGRYLWIINPLYNNKYYDDSLSSKALNGLMKVYGVPAGTTVYTYKLKQSATSLGLDNDIPSVSGGVGTVSQNEGEDTPFTSTEDNTTPYTQTVGGDTSAPETVSAAEGIRQTLDQFVEMFNNLFTSPAEHIQHLIQAGQGFIQALTGLFTFLPSSVIDVFTSALILMIVIGVIKMLL